ncbi:S8 family serine peptidase [Rufibacter sp. XAAS-G3-1]|uniref:S8 family serine peptidase n=1 Tax=Rufibacter sp. XAAS-G3-1 TaxID=2729134 RepID=UPI0015E78DC4|nr:S8 family serine peptidase [Rufibacter sp. XAAS-G3-1]
MLVGSIQLVQGQTPRALASNPETSKRAPVLRQPARGLSVSTVRVQAKDATAFRNWLRLEVPETATGTGNTLLLSNLSSQKYGLLAQWPFVTFIDVGGRVPQEEAHLQNADLTVNKVEAVHLRYPDLHGKNLAVSVKENPFDVTDIDFKGRVGASSQPVKTATPHATSMATLVAGGGNSSPNGRGVAWQSQLITSDFSRLLPDETSLLKSQKVSVQNHAYGVGVENYYGLESQAYDAQVLDYPELLHVFSSGNSGTQTSALGSYAGISGFANLTGQFKVSKNTLSVGAVDTSGLVSPMSSRGPTFDGRIKPEVVAYGESGSSEASAVVSGVALLLQQVYQGQHNGTLPSAALVKAALINSADEKGRPEVDYEAGFGNVDALGAVQSLAERRYFTGSLAQGEVQTFPISVPVGAAKVKVTLAWHDVAAEPTNPIALVNDLDLSLVKSANLQQWLPWGLSAYPHRDSLSLPARRKVDRVNNVEQVSLALPSAGDYQIQVAGYKLASATQAFSVVYEFEEPFTWGYPTKASILKSGQVNRLRWQVSPVTSTTTARLEYRWAGQEWQLLNQNVALQAQRADWFAPDSAGKAQVRLVTSTGEVLVSEEFYVSPVLSLQVGYHCGEEVLLLWPQAKGVTEYEVFRLGEKYLEPVARVQDTLLVLSKSQNPALHYAVAPVIAGQAGLRSFTVNYTEQDVQCYIRQFLARQQVTDSVLLDVELSTLYGLTSIALEKREKGSFQLVQALWPQAQTSFTVADITPTPGRNEYRLKLEAENGAVYYSEIEAVFYTPQDFVQVFPNPAIAGEDVQIVALEDKLTRIQILDHTGRLVREIQQDGALKSITTAGLKAGVYFLKLLDDSGYKFCRVVLL